MRKVLFLLLMVFIISGCKNSVPDYSGDKKISAEDFLKAFHELKLPVTVSDTTLKNFPDTTTISSFVFGQFVAGVNGNKYLNTTTDTLIIHPVGLIHQKDKDYLLATFSASEKMKLNVFVFNDKHKYLSSFAILDNTKSDKYHHSVLITEEPTFILKREKTAPDNTLLYSRNGFAFNEASNSFTQVLHDSNEDTAKNNEVLNPIDTLPSTNKFAGDYITDKKNFISIRDGKNAKSYMFFIHFEKNSDCTGELKGTMTLTDEKNAVFTESGDPCVINFKFSNNSINIKEQGNCGNHRGITCPFNFTFKKKVQPNKN